MGESISLNDFILYYLKKWKFILIFAVIFAVIFGSYKGISNILTTKDSEKMAEVSQQYDEQLDLYENRQKTLDTDLSLTKSTRDKLIEYTDKSVLMTTDSSRSNVFVLNYLLETEGYELDNELSVSSYKSKEVAQAYILKIRNDAYIDYLCEKSGIPLDTSFFIETLGLKFENNILTVNFYYNDAEAGNKILEFTKTYLADQEIFVQTNVSEHTIKLLDENIFTVKDANLEIQQKTVLESLNQKNNQIQSINDQLQILQKPDTPAVLSNNGILKDSIKFGLIGAFFGAFMAIALLFLFDTPSKDKYKKEDYEDLLGITVLGFVNSDELEEIKNE